MKVHIGDNKFVIKIGHKPFYFDLPKKSDDNLINEIHFIIQNNELLAVHTIKKEIRQLLSKYKHGNNIHDTENSKTNELHKFAINLSQTLLINLFKSCHIFAKIRLKKLKQTCCSSKLV